MEEKYFCKYCGDYQTELLYLLNSVCSKSPSSYHQLYHGSKRGRQGGTKEGRYFRKNYHYFCKYCGHPHVTIAELTRMSCIKGPSGYHQPYEGEDKPIYVCKYCDSFSKSIKCLTRGSCPTSPNKHHQPKE